MYSGRVDSITCQLEAHARLFKALGEDTRLRIIAMLSHGELCVCHLIQGLELPQSTVSRHLSILRDAGLVRTRKAGRWVHYRLAPPPRGVGGQMLQQLVAHLAADPDLGARVVRSQQSCGPGPRARPVPPASCEAS